MDYDNWLEKGITWGPGVDDVCDCNELTCERCRAEMNILFEVDRSSTHRARKDHYDTNGKLEVTKGKRYRYRGAKTVSHGGALRAAMVSLTTATGGDASASVLAIARPRAIWMPIVSKYPGLTTCQSPLGFSPCTAG